MEIELILIVLVIIGIGWMIADRYYLRQQTPQAISPEEAPPPQYVDQWLKAKQFAPLATCRVKRLAQTPLTEWVYTSGEIVAETIIVEDQVPVFLFTLFEDNSVVQTNYPGGTEADTPNYHCHIVPGGLDAAYADHLQQIAKWGRKPVPLRSADDYQRFSEMLKQNYTGKRSQRQFALFIGGMTVLLLSFILFLIADAFEPLLIPALFLMLIGFGVIYMGAKSPEFDRMFGEMLMRFSGRATPKSAGKPD